MAKELKGILKLPHSATHPSPLRESVTFGNQKKVQKIHLKRKSKRTPLESIPRTSDNASLLDTNVHKVIGTCASNAKRDLPATTSQFPASTLVNYLHSTKCPTPPPMNVQTNSSKPAKPAQYLTANLEAIIDASLEASLADHLEAKLEANIKVQKSRFLSWQGLAKVDNASKKQAPDSSDEQNSQLQQYISRVEEDNQILRDALRSSLEQCIWFKSYGIKAEKELKRPTEALGQVATV